MEVGEGGMYHCEVYNAVKSNQPSLLRELLTQCDFDLNKYYGEEGSILNVAIENAGLEVLVNLLQVEYSVLPGNIELSREKYELLEKPCGVDQLTPLMKAVRSGKGDVVAFLIKCNVSVNAVNNSKSAAIDFVSNGGIALLLLRADSLLHGLRSKEGQKKLEILVSECEELKIFFERRERLHNAIEKGCWDDEVKELIDSEQSQYLINSKGETVLWQAAKAVNADVWAYLNVKRLKYAGRFEEHLVKMSKDSYEDRFNRSLLNYFFEVQGTHMMKMIAKSRVFGKRGVNGGGLGKQIKKYYEALAEYDETEILLEVLQDEHDFEVVFDFDSDSVKYVCLKCSGDQVWGLTDFHRKRVYVGAKGGSDGGKCHVLGTLSHELAHKALMVVFQNKGKPFSEDDSEAREKYQSILKEIMCLNNLANCDEAIRRVAKYDESLWEKELIVRVPEIIAKYCHTFEDEEVMGDCKDTVADDGFDLLEAQVEPLLNYYRDHVMPAFREYVDSIFTSNKMTVKIMSEYQKLLLNSMNERVSVGPEVQDMEKYLHDHNGLKVLLVSCVQLCYAHLKMVHIRRGENVLLVGWSQYNQPKSGYLDGLSNGAFDLLVVRWDVEEEPKFCRRSKCFGDCIGNMFGGLCSRVVVVLTKAPKSLKKVTPLEYVWTDLSDSTKEDILKKRVNFVGRPTTLNDVISEALPEGNSVEAFMREHLLSSDIAFLLKDEVVNIGKVSGWAAKNEAELLELKCYMQRHFSQRSISFTESLLFKGSDLFVVSNACVQDLLSLKFGKSLLSIWDPLFPDKNAKCYVLNENVEADVGEIFRKICSSHSDKKGIHLLELRCGHFLYIKSQGSVESLLGSVNYESEEMPISERSFLEEKINVVMTETKVDLSQTLVPVIIADEPGCGKSFIVNNFVSDSIKYFSSVWVSVVDLNFYAQTRSPFQLSELDSTRTGRFEELLQMLFKMIGHGNSSFEKNVLKLFSQKACRVVVIFDGFDEICPNYRENVIGFLEALRSKSAIKVCATTRLHERRTLELKLNAIAYKLIPFSEVEQVDFLSRYWKARLRNYSREERLKKLDNLESGMKNWLMEKYPEVFKCEESVQLATASQNLGSGVTLSKNIDFKTFAEKLILSFDHPFEDVDKFTRTPLHIKMVAFVLFEEDFKLGSYWDLGQLYAKFLEIKLYIFEREKVLASGTVSSEKSFSMAKKRIFELLENLSANIFFDPNFFVIDRGEMYDALSIGLTLEKEETYQFIHRTFGEFFFAKWLLREAQRELVSKFWLEQLFADEGSSRVRFFLEDILHSYYTGMKPSMLLEESVATKVPLLSPSVFPDKRLSVCLNACLFGIIVEGFTSLLQYFAGGFGSELIKLFMGCENFPSGSAKSTEETVNLILGGMLEEPIAIIPEFDIPGMRIYRHPKLIHSVRAKRYNAFTLTYRWHSSPNFGVVRRDKNFKIVRMMFALIEQHKMTEDLNKVFYKHGFSWIIPVEYGNGTYKCYLSEVVNFLTEKKEVFKDSLQKAFVNESEIWNNVQEMAVFDLMCTVANFSVEESEFESMFLKNDGFFEMWLRTVRFADTDNILKIWHYVKMNMSRQESRCQFLFRYCIDKSDIHRPQYQNVLTKAVLSNELVKVTLVWELCMEVMDRETFNELFRTSVVDGRPSLEHFTFALPPVIFKFIRAQLINGHMNEDEVVKMLLSQDSDGNHSLLEINGHDYVLESLFLFHELLAVNLRSKAGEVLMEMEKIFRHLIKILVENEYKRYNKGIPSYIAVKFGEIVSLGMSSLKDEFWTLYDPQGGERLPESEEPVLMAHLVLIYNFLELVWECNGRELPFKFLKSDPAYSRSCPSILHHTLRCKISHAVGFICAAVWKFVGDSGMVDLLFLKGSFGNTVFHEAARDGCVHSWGKFYDVARILLKESALGDVHGVANENGKCVQDIFRFSCRKNS